VPACAGDDIDTHCIGPRWCDRQAHFFGQEPHCLEALLSQCPWVTDLQAVSDAYVPVIKLCAHGAIDIDLTYAQLPLSEVSLSIDVQVRGHVSSCTCLLRY
jgi:poly(A) polymerase Pap1